MVPSGCPLASRAITIVKGIAELHGGRVSVASRPGAGCDVTLSFPDAQHDEIVISA
jgi:signal transduction histidine kinase